MPEFRDREIATIPKNQSKVVRVALAEVNGHDLISMRVFYDAGEGEYRPSKAEGFTLTLARLPKLIEALQSAESEARRLGLIRTQEGRAA